MPRFLKVAREQIADLQREREMHPKFSPDRLSQNALGAERHLGFCLRRPLFRAILRQPAEWKKLNKQVAKTYRKANHQSEN